MGFLNYLIKNLGSKEILTKETTQSKAQNILENIDNQSVAIMRPKEFQDVVDLVDFIANGKTAIVDFNKINSNQAEHSIDFLSGAIFALRGSFERVSDGLYIYAPSGIKLLKPKKRKVE